MSAVWSVEIAVTTDQGARYEGMIGETYVRNEAHGVGFGGAHLVEPLRSIEHMLLAIVTGELPSYEKFSGIEDD